MKFNKVFLISCGATVSILALFAKQADSAFWAGWTLFMLGVALD